MPTVSVLMPVYNAQSYIEAATESILGQTYRDFEFIIVDDGSTDRSLELLRRYEKLDPRIRLISRPNTGYLPALNEMLAVATGELVARMDADDESLPDRFQIQVDFLRSHEDVGAVGGTALLIDPDGAPVKLARQPLDHRSIDEAHMSGAGGTIPHPSVMMRTELLRRVGGYRKDYWPAEDLDLFLRLAEVCRLANVPETVLRYRLDMRSTSHKHHAKQRLAADAAVNDARRRRGAPPATGAVVSADGAGPEDFRTKWAWWALGAGNVETARKYAFAAWVRAPWSPSRIRLLASAVRGR